MKILKMFISGLFISLGGTIFLAIENKIVGGVFFSIALLSVLNFKTMLYTGRIGYVLEYSKEERLELLVTILFNVIGTIFFAFIIFLMGNATINTRVLTVVDAKMSEVWYEVIARSFMCGVMMVIAVEGFKKFDNPLMKNLIVILSIALFVISGFEHSIANFFYYYLALFNGRGFFFNDLLVLLFTVLGNSLGSIFFYFILSKSYEKIEENKAKNKQKNEEN